MASNKFFQNVVVAAATLSVAVLAGCPGTPTQPTGSSSPSAQPSSPTASGSPGAPASPGASAPTSASPAPTSIPSTPDTSAKATIHGVVFDDTLQRLSDVTVTGKILGAGTFANGSDSLSVTTQVGSYALNGAPTGQTILVTVTKSGFTTRQKTIVPLANLQGKPAANQLDFGTDDAGGDQTFAMSDKPEVTAMTPTPDGTGIDSNTSFTLTWSEPVNKDDVETNFAIGLASSGATYPMTVNGVTLGAAGKMYNPSDDKFGTTNNATIDAGEFILDSSAVNYAWSNSNQTVTVTFRNGYKLPTDKDANRLPQFGVGFKGAVKDSAGSASRSDQFFRVSPAQLGKNAYRFTVAADTTAPQLISASIVNGGSTDKIIMNFNKPMMLLLSEGTRMPTTVDPNRVDALGNIRIVGTGDATNVNSTLDAVVAAGADETAATTVGLQGGAEENLTAGQTVYFSDDTTKTYTIASVSNAGNSVTLTAAVGRNVADGTKLNVMHAKGVDTGVAIKAGDAEANATFINTNAVADAGKFVVGSWIAFSEVAASKGLTYQVKAVDAATGKITFEGDGANGGKIAANLADAGTIFLVSGPTTGMTLTQWDTMFATGWSTTFSDDRKTMIVETSNGKNGSLTNTAAPTSIKVAVPSTVYDLAGNSMDNKKLEVSPSIQ